MLLLPYSIGCFLLLLVGTLAQSCDKQITVNINKNGSLVLPMVSRVNFTSSSLDHSSESGFMWSNESSDVIIEGYNYTVDLMYEYFNETYTVTDGKTTFQFSVSYDLNIIACQTHNFGYQFQFEDISIECFPITSCDNDATFTFVTWKKTQNFSENNPYEELSSGTDNNRVSYSVATYNGVDVSNGRLQITNADINSVGYYAVYGNQSTLIHSFTIFTNATRQSHLESLIIIKGTKNPFSDMHCVFESFPPSTVTWTRGSNRSLVQPTNRVSIINISNTQTDENVVWSNDNRDFSFTINGGIVIDELDYVDADMYYCMADNGYRTEEAHIRLRVRDPLRPLWPSLGIIAVFIVTLLLIVAGSIGERIREGKGKGALEPQEINAAFTNSPYSQKVSVTDDDVSVNRRISSTVELLPKSS